TASVFSAPARILAARDLILARASADRARALDKLRPVQHADFVGIFRAMDGLPVTIRLLDPPLHEFLPTSETEIREVAAALGADAAEVRAKIDALREFN